MEYESLRKFKSGLTTAFDTARVGEKVTIMRRGVRYLLVSEDAVKEAKKQATPENKKNDSEPLDPREYLERGLVGPVGPVGPMPEQIPEDYLAAGEYECCIRNAPCKHWVWDIQSGEGYVNTLSGRKRETTE